MTDGVGSTERATVLGDAAWRGLLVMDHEAVREQLVRFGGECLAVAPPFVSTAEEIVAMVEGLRRSLRAVPA